MHNWVIILDYEKYIDYKCIKCGVSCFTLSFENHSNHHLYAGRNNLQVIDMSISCEDFIIKKIIE